MPFQGFPGRLIRICVTLYSTSDRTGFAVPYKESQIGVTFTVELQIDRDVG
jgi:hypothetical protein